MFFKWYHSKARNFSAGKKILLYYQSLLTETSCNNFHNITKYILLHGFCIWGVTFKILNNREKNKKNQIFKHIIRVAVFSFTSDINYTFYELYFFLNVNKFWSARKNVYFLLFSLIKNENILFFLVNTKNLH